MAPTLVLTPAWSAISVGGRAFLVHAPSPLALVVEPGVGSARANSYVTLDYARTYFLGRRLFSDAWTSAPRDTQITALIEASRVLDSEFIWVGDGPINPEQGLGWPQCNARDRYRRAVVGVPRAIKDATCELALFLMAQDRLVGREGVGISKVIVDSIAIWYDKTESPETFPTYVSRMLLGYGTPIRTSATIRQVSLYRV